MLLSAGRYEMLRSVVVLVTVVLVTGSDIPEDNYQVLTSMWGAPVRTEYRRKAEDYQLNTLDMFEDNEIDPVAQSDTKESRTVKKDEAVFNATSSRPEVEAGRSEQDNSIIQDGLHKMRELYNGCNKKINKRIHYLLNAMKLKNNMEKDLFEFKEFVLSLVSCMKVTGFRYLDDVLGGEVVPVTDYMEFVKQKRSVSNVQVLPTVLNGKLSLPDAEEKNLTMPQYAAKILDGNWKTLLLDRMAKLLESHTLKFHVGQDITEGRGRRRDHRMFAMMVMGFMIMSTILIPMGFQFLTVLGGKSILMAKMALIMSAINGLKKIATNNVGYGFYHTAPDVVHPHHHHHDFHEKVFETKPDGGSQLPFNIFGS